MSFHPIITVVPSSTRCASAKYVIDLQACELLVEVGGITITFPLHFNELSMTGII